MIFVTLGTEKFPFYRLCQYIDKLIKLKFSVLAVLLPTRSTPYKFKSSKIQSVDYLSYSDYKNTIRRASLIIAHAGVGTILDVVTLDKPLIVVPRKAKLKEHLDDQQLELVSALKNDNPYFPVAYTFKDLVELIRSRPEPVKPSSSKIKLVKYLDSWIQGT